MNMDRLEHLADVTRRYGRYRPCGAGLGVLWGGLILGALGALVLLWTRTEYAARAIAAQTFWRFLRDTPLAPPGWLQAAALAAPLLAWLGLIAIQQWVDARFGAVTAAPASHGRSRAPTWFAPAIVVTLAGVLAAVVLWDAGTAAVRGAAAMVAIGAWAIYWGQRSRDELTLFVMLAVSVPSLYVLMATDPNGNMAANSLIIIGAYGTLMVSLLVQGATRYSAFLDVRADLDAMHAVEE